MDAKRKRITTVGMNQSRCSLESPKINFKVCPNPLVVLP